MSFFSRKVKPDNSDYDNAYDTDYYSQGDATYPDESAFNSAEKDDLNIEDTPKRSTAGSPISHEA